MKMKNYLIWEPSLAVFDQILLIQIYTDASLDDTGADAMKKSQIDGVKKQVTYLFKKKLNEAEKNVRLFKYLGILNA